MPHGINCATGEIYIMDQKECDITAGMDLRMLHADEIKFRLVSGTVAIGEHMTSLLLNTNCILSKSWTIFSTLGNALDTEFHE